MYFNKLVKMQLMITYLVEFLIAFDFHDIARQQARKKLVSCFLCKRKYKRKSIIHIYAAVLVRIKLHTPITPFPQKFGKGLKISNLAD